MDKRELRAIQGFLSIVAEGLDTRHEGVVFSDWISELSRIIQRLMHERFGPGSLRAKVQMAMLERNARRYRREIEAKLCGDHPAD
jgi:hypothetical protein